MIYEGVSFVLATLSLLGYIVFVVGFGLFYKALSPDDELPKVFLNTRWSTILTPMWLFGSVSIPLYMASFLRVFFHEGNKSHILQSIITFFHFFYMLGAATTILIGGLLLIQQIQIVLEFRQTKEIAGMVAGCLIASFFHWVLEITWSLLELKCRRNRDEYQYRELIGSTQLP